MLIIRTCCDRRGLFDALFHAKDHLQLLNLFKQVLLEAGAVLLSIAGRGATLPPYLAQFRGQFLIDYRQLVLQLILGLVTLAKGFLDTPSLVLSAAVESVVDLR